MIHLLKKISFIIFLWIFISYFGYTTFWDGRTPIDDVEDEFEILPPSDPEAPDPIDGVCGWALNTPTLTAPTGNLCSSWNPTAVLSNTGDFTWSCNGQQTGSDVSCSAPRLYTITFDPNGGTPPTPVTSKDIVYNTSIWALPTSTYWWHTFLWWFPSQTWWTQVSNTTLVTQNTIWYAQWSITPTPPSSSSWGGSSGGWGWSIITPVDNCPDGDYSPSYYDNECGTPTLPPTPWENQDAPSTPSDPETQKDDEDSSVPPLPFLKNEKRSCEANELAAVTKCTYPNVEFNFTDIDDTFAKEYIQVLAKAQIVQWYYNSELFKPNNSISRSEYLKVLLRAFCIDYSKMMTDKIPFADVDKDAWEAKVIAKALELEILESENTNFRPHQPISRGESLKLLFRLSWVIPQHVVMTEFVDVDKSGWEIKYIQRAYEMCIVDGQVIEWEYLFEPYKNMTRAEVVKVVFNALNLQKQ